MTALILLVFFGATLIRSALGFGEALIAVPILALLLPVQTAAPVAVLISITVAAVVIVRDWRHIHVRGALRLIAATIVGIPFGLLLLRGAPEWIVKTVLGAVVTAFAAWGLRQRQPYELDDDRYAWIFGVAAGVLGGAYGMNGPPLVMYGALRRWHPEQFRATLQGYFLPASAAGLAGYAAAGLWTADVTRLYVFSLPGAIVAILIGRAIHRRLDPARFFRWVYAVLLATGAALLVQAATGS